MAKEKISKTNVARLLDKDKIKYELVPYEVDENDLSCVHGCSPIGMKKHFPTYIHHTCNDFDYIYVSAGVRGLQVKIAPADLIKVSRAEVCTLFE